MSNFIHSARIIRFEGVGSPTSCELLTDNQNALRLNTGLSQKPFHLVAGHKYQISLLGDPKLSVTFFNTIFVESGMQWLPLLDQADDFIGTMPFEVSKPRVLLLLNRKPSEEAQANLITEEAIGHICNSQAIEEENTMIIYEDNEIENSLNLEGSVENMINHSIDLKTNTKNIEEITEVHLFYQQNLAKQQKITERLINDVNEKNLELSKALKQIFSMKTKLHRIESENRYLNSMNSGILSAKLTDLLSQVEESKQQISMLKQALVDSKDEKKLTKILLETNQNPSASLTSKTNKKHRQSSTPYSKQFSPALTIDHHKPSQAASPQINSLRSPEAALNFQKPPPSRLRKTSCKSLY